MNIVSIVGARPQFIKAAAVSRALRQRHHEFLVHTGQHYDYEMSGVFFDGLQLPRPDVNLETGSGTHGFQTGAMLPAIEKILAAHRPDCVLVYGDTNSTLAGALAAAKMRTPVAHVEAGLRSYDRGMPEEINRVVADHLSDLLLCPSASAVRSLAAEGITRGVYDVGDVMLEVLNWAMEELRRKPSRALTRLGLTERRYLLATAHRSENTDPADRLAEIVKGLEATGETVVFPAHPRTRKAMAECGLQPGPNVLTIEPVGYLDMVALAAASRLIMTDSGGLQKEAYWLGVPCVTLRDRTEWVETLEAGWNVLAGADAREIARAAESFAPARQRPTLYGDGRAAARCVELLEKGFGRGKRTASAD